jgi:outer membrane protein assembly factor BamE
MRLSFLTVFLVLPLLLTACGSLSNQLAALQPYKADIQQGNAVTSDMAAKLKPGMTQAQVRFLLGTPLVTDPFHPNRWDYFYRATQGGFLTAQQRLTVVFENDKLAKVEGYAFLPPAISKPAAEAPKVEAPAPTPSETDKK